MLTIIIDMIFFLVFSCIGLLIYANMPLFKNFNLEMICLKIIFHKI